MRVIKNRYEMLSYLTRRVQQYGLLWNRRWPIYYGLIRESRVQKNRNIKNMHKSRLRYVDGMFVICQHSREQRDQILTNLCYNYPSIKFTLNVYKNKQLPFLVVLVDRNITSASTRVCRKPPRTVSFRIKRTEMKTLYCLAAAIRSSEKCLGEELNNSVKDLYKIFVRAEVCQKRNQESCYEIRTIMRTLGQ